MSATSQFNEVTERNVNQWLHGRYDEETKATIRTLIKENPQEITDAFYKTLSFGTGGLRAIMGVGTNRMNIYTIQATTQGLANYLKKQPNRPEKLSVFIGYDSRQNSRLFAEETAKVFAGNGFYVYLFRDIRPTPLVSFGCRLKKCCAAIMITASHNPPEYNGYKVYWSDGAQILPPHDKAIIAEVQKINDISNVKKTQTLDSALIEIIDNEVDEAYFKAIVPLQNYPEENRKFGSTLKIVYTSLHGTGITVMPKALAAWGFSNVVYVEKQIIPDGHFTTAPIPNPEDPSALKLGIETLEASKGDLLLATDPDADRVAVAVQHAGKIQLLTGNQTACLCLYHLCEAMSKQQTMPKKAAFIKTIVTTELFKVIAHAYQATCFDVLTGFKYIAEKIQLWEQDPSGYQYIFGGEESFGYLLGTLTRDKDAILSSALICEVALHAKQQGKTLIDLLHDIYNKYGIFLEDLISINFEESKAGKESMEASMNKLRSNPPIKINGLLVVAIEDYLTSIKTFLPSEKTEPLALPKSDALLFWLEDESKLIVRPSGTEPKIKLYCGVVNKKFKTIEQGLSDAKEHVSGLLKSMASKLKEKR